jgi:hypothetical protein
MIYTTKKENVNSYIERDDNEKIGGLDEGDLSALGLWFVCNFFLFARGVGARFEIVRLRSALGLKMVYSP